MTLEWLSKDMSIKWELTNQESREVRHHFDVVFVFIWVRIKGCSLGEQSCLQQLSSPALEEYILEIFEVRIILVQLILQVAVFFLFLR